MATKICLVLTAPTIKENLALVDLYRKWIDIAELRVDCLNQDERLNIRKFPALSNIPCILTIRRNTDGGRFLEGEGSRIAHFARGLAFADTDRRKNFAYVDFEEDLNVPSLEEAARAFGTKIIRSIHNMNGPITNLKEKVLELRRTQDEIAKIAFMPRNLSDITNLFKEAKKCTDTEYILIAMGPFGQATRILAPLVGSAITYTSALDNNTFSSFNLGQLDPTALHELYQVRNITASTSIFGVTGNPLTTTSSPLIHNRAYKKQGIDAVYIPIKAETIEESIEFANEIGIQGLSVTNPFKEAVLPNVGQLSKEAGEIGASNTIVKQGQSWVGHNTDALGFSRALMEFVGRKNLSGMRISIIGAGGVARAIAYAIKELRGKACVFNRTADKARELAALYNFKWASLDPGNRHILETYSDIIIQTTNVGMASLIDQDPLDFYSFSGHEAVYDVIYAPEKTKLLQRAEKAGCSICNGYSMLQYQAELQFKLFTGLDFEI